MQEQCQIAENGYTNDEATIQHHNINALFNNWQKIIKLYRRSGEEYDSDEDQDQIDPSLATDSMHDVLAESITKLLAFKPPVERSPDFGKQELIDSTLFVNYERIDQVEHEDEDMLHSTDIESNHQDTMPDTLEAQSKLRSRELYLSTKMNLLEILETNFEKSLQGDFYQTVSNTYNIQLTNYKEIEAKLIE